MEGGGGASLYLDWRHIIKMLQDSFWLVANVLVACVQVIKQATEEFRVLALEMGRFQEPVYRLGPIP